MGKKKRFEHNWLTIKPKIEEVDEKQRSNANHKALACNSPEMHPWIYARPDISTLGGLETSENSDRGKESVRGMEEPQKWSSRIRIARHNRGVDHEGSL